MSSDSRYVLPADFPRLRVLVDNNNMDNSQGNLPAVWSRNNAIPDTTRVRELTKQMLLNAGAEDPDGDLDAFVGQILAPDAHANIAIPPTPTPRPAMAAAAAAAPPAQQLAQPAQQQPVAQPQTDHSALNNAIAQALKNDAPEIHVKPPEGRGCLACFKRLFCCKNGNC